MKSKTFTRPLPELQQKELDFIVQKIIDTGLAEMIILYGSFARGNFRLKDRIRPNYPPTETVPPKSTKLRSDFDLLVLVEKPEQVEQMRLLTADFDLLITTPLDLKFLDFKQMNTLHLNKDDFTSDVLKSRIILHDTGKFVLEKRHKLSPERRKELAQEEFTTYLGQARDFYETFEFHYGKEKLGLAAFDLQQTAEHALQMIQLVFVCKRIQTHNLQRLRMKAVELVPAVAVFFPQNTPQEIADLKYLSDSYVGGRYLSKKLFPIVQAQIESWSKQVKLLMEIAEKACKERIEQGWGVEDPS